MRLPLAFSGFLVFLATACTSELEPKFGASLTLTVVGNGSVSSSPPGILCPDRCTAHFSSGAVITLTAEAAAPVHQVGSWSPPCPGGNSCIVIAAQTTSVEVVFFDRVLITGSGAVSLVSEPPGLACSGGECVGWFDPRDPLATVRAIDGFRRWSAPCLGAGTSCGVDPPQDVTAKSVVPGETLWAHQVGGPALDRGNGITAYGGVVFTTGEGDDLVVSPFGTHDGPGLRNGYLYALDARTGDPRWSTYVESPAFDFGWGLSVHNGLVYWTGLVGSASAFIADQMLPDQPGHRGRAFYAAISATSGDVQWAETISLPGADEVGFMLHATDAGRALLYRSSEAADPPVERDSYLSFLNPDGTVDKTRDFKGPASQNAFEARVTEDGDAIVAGWFNRNFTTTLSLTTAGGGGEADMFVARVPATGSVAWERAFGTAGPDVVDALAYRDGIVYFGGHYGGMIDFDGTILTNGGDDDGFIAIASATDGKVTKAVGFGSTGEEVVSALDVNPAGEVVACGVFGGTVDFLGQDGVSNGGGDLFVMKLTTALTLDWLVTFGGGSDDVFRACAFDDDGGVLATGRFGSAVDFGTGTFTSEGNDDSVILRLAP